VLTRWKREECVPGTRASLMVIRPRGGCAGSALRASPVLEQTNPLEAPSPDPRVTIQLPEPGKLQLVLRFPAPDRGRSRIEQAILRRYLVEMTGPDSPLSEK